MYVLNAIFDNFSGLVYQSQEREQCQWQTRSTKECLAELKPIPGICSIKFTLHNLNQFCNENSSRVALINGVPLCYFHGQTLLCKYILKISTLSCFKTTLLFLFFRRS